MRIYHPFFFGINELLKKHEPLFLVEPANSITGPGSPRIQCNRLIFGYLRFPS